MNKPYRLVDTTEGLRQAARQLQGASSYFIDTEFEQSYRESKLCLVQVSVGGEPYLIDTVRLSALDTLTDTLASPGAEWVLHAGRTDVELLLEAFNLDEPPEIFDTQVVWGLLGPEHSVSLAYLNFRLLGVRSEKGHQADSWDGRPLPVSQLAYAASDVETLPLLQERLVESLEKEGKGGLAHEVSREFCHVASRGSSRRRTLSMGDFRSAWELDSGGQAALRFLIDWYNDAPEDEKPAGLKPRSLFLIARRMPESAVELLKIKGMPRRWASRHGDSLMGKLMRATHGADEKDYPLLEPEPYVTFEELRVDAFLNALRYASGRAVSIAPDICFPPWLLQDRLKPRLLRTGDVRSGIEDLEGWRRDWLAHPYANFCETWLRHGID